MFKNIVSKFNSKVISLGQAVGAIKVAPTAAHLQVAFVALGIATLLIGSESNAFASFGLDERTTDIDNTQIDEAIRTIFNMLEGSFGALIAVGAGIMAVISSAFGQYRAALGCLIVAVGSFILRSFVFTWFNVESLQN